MSTRANRSAIPDHLKLFADREAADQWFARYDPEGVAFEYPVLGKPGPKSPD
ncbi:hypothetical protein [Bradyrhizobium sp. URHC0002]|jgi:hypothetical protein